MKLMEDVTANKRKMKELEDNLLFRLTSTQVCGQKYHSKPIMKKLRGHSRVEIQISLYDEYCH